MIKELLASKSNGTISTHKSDAIPIAKGYFLDMVCAVEAVKRLEALIASPTIEHDPDTTIQIKQETKAGLLTVIFSTGSKPTALCATLEEV